MRRRALLLAGAALAAPAPSRGQEAGFAIPVGQDDRVAPGMRRDALLRWGDRVLADAPAWDPENPDPEAASAQCGWDIRVCGLAVAPRAADGAPRGVLAIAHPTVEAAMAWPGPADRPAVAAAMQGASLVNLERRGGRWMVIDGGFQTRRLGASTLCRMAGPAAGESGAVMGVLGLTGGGMTPSGRLLLTEGEAEAWLRRLAPAEPRFADGAGYGWVVELDPFDPQFVPVKRSALGRMAHGDAAAATGAAGQAVVYLCDRRPGGMLYRFVSAEPSTASDALDGGVLSVARIEGAALRWLPLPGTAEAVRDPAGAGRAAGGSALEVPAGLGLDPRRPRLLVACRGGNGGMGHVLEILPESGDHAAGVAAASLLFAAGDPAGPGRYGGGGLPAGAAFPEHPDSVAVDARGRAWIGTHLGHAIRAQAAGVFVVPLEGPRRGVPAAAYGAPRGAAIGGVLPLPESDTVLLGVRHPGAGPGQSFARPGTRWPQFQPGIPPRPTLVGLGQG